MYTISDSVFGKLERHGQSWQGSVYLEFLDQEIDFEIIDHADDNLPSQEVRAAFSSFVQNHQKLFQAIEKAVFYYCQSNFQEYMNRNSLDDIQVIEHPKEIWQQLEISHIDFVLDEQDKVTISIICGFSWDMEHGLDIDLFDNQIGIAEGGTHWLGKTHFNLEGNPVQT